MERQASIGGYQMIRMFISDLDGTLLNKYHIADKTINQAIEEADRRGYRFAVATGRHMRNHQRFGLGFLKHTQYIIAMNGALVIDNKGKIIDTSAIEPNKVIEIQDMFPEISFEFLTAQHAYVKHNRFKHFLKGFKNTPTFKNFGRALLNLLVGQFHYGVDDEFLKTKSILKLECITNSAEEHERLVEYLEANQNYFSFAYNDEVHFEITAQNVNKRQGILALLKKINVHPDRVAVYGNDSNDVEMLEYFIHSYAPSSAKEIAKKVAKNQIGDANDHSVVKHILATMKKQDLYKK